MDIIIELNVWVYAGEKLVSDKKSRVTQKPEKKHKTWMLQKC